MDEVTCCVASGRDARVFSGGADCNVHAWSPPPCGLSRPAPPEQPACDEPPPGPVAQLQAPWLGGGGARWQHLLAAGRDEQGGGGGGAAAGSSAGGGAPLLEDRDAWSDDDDEPARQPPRPGNWRGGGPSQAARRANKRARR